jgi:hypothetical protein
MMQNWYERSVTTLFSGPFNGVDAWVIPSQARIIVPVAAITRPPRDGTWIAVEVSTEPTTAGALGGAYVGSQADAGNVWDFAGDQSQLTSQGSPSRTFNDAEVVRLNAHFRYRANKALVLSFYFSAGASFITSAYSNPGELCTTCWMTNVDAGYDQPGSTTLPFMNVTPNWRDFVKSIEVSS